MLKGRYIFSENGKEIYRSENIITLYGKRFLTNFIAGNIIDYRKDLAFGIDSTTAVDNDTRLGFEFYRIPVEFGTTDIYSDENGIKYFVVYKTVLPVDLAGVIKEVGTYPSRRTSSNSFDSKFISDFSDSFAWRDAESFNPERSTTGALIGEDVLNFISGTGTEKEYFCTITETDFSGYSVNDSIRLSYYKNDNNLEKIKIRFYSSDIAYYEVEINDNAGTGNKISDDILLSVLYAGSNSENPDISKINKIGIVIVPKTGLQSTVGMDGLRINDEDSFDPTYGLISRSVLSTPLTKVIGRLVDVEYRMELSF
jgi:hypothetical protein